jgi:nucleoside-diphosphate-sugar epimerase
MSKTAFVTGGTGFVGSHLVEALLESGYGEIRCLVRSDLKWLAGLPITPVRGDLGDADTLRRAVEGVDYVYHVAGLTRATNAAAFESANVLGTMRLLDAVAEANPGLRRVLVTSSLAVVGEAGVEVADETTPMLPISLYGHSKARMESAMQRRRDPFPVTVVRPPAVYGPREADIYTFFRALRWGLAPIVGSGTQPDLSLVYAPDLVRGMIRAAESERAAGETFFLSGLRDYDWHTVRDTALEALGQRRALTLRIAPRFATPIGTAVERVGSLFGQQPALTREKAREIVDAVKRCSHQKAAVTFGYQPTTSLQRGLATTMQWYRDSGWL